MRVRNIETQIEYDLELIGEGDDLEKACHLTPVGMLAGGQILPVVMIAGGFTPNDQEAANYMQRILDKMPDHEISTAAWPFQPEPMTEGGLFIPEGVDLDAPATTSSKVEITDEEHASLDDLEVGPGQAEVDAAVAENKELDEAEPDAEPTPPRPTTLKIENAVTFFDGSGVQHMGSVTEIHGSPELGDLPVINLSYTYGGVVYSATSVLHQDATEGVPPAWCAIDEEPKIERLVYTKEQMVLLLVKALRTVASVPDGATCEPAPTFQALEALVNKWGSRFKEAIFGE